MCAGDVFFYAQKQLLAGTSFLPQVTCAFFGGEHHIQTHAGFGHPQCEFLKHPPCLLANTQKNEVPFLSVKSPQ